MPLIINRSTTIPEADDWQLFSLFAAFLFISQGSFNNWFVERLQNARQARFCSWLQLCLRISTICIEAKCNWKILWARGEPTCRHAAGYVLVLRHCTLHIIWEKVIFRVGKTKTKLRLLFDWHCQLSLFFFFSYKWSSRMQKTSLKIDELDFFSFLWLCKCGEKKKSSQGNVQKTKGRL